METAVIIPARSGSKSISDKNLQTIIGRSLIEWAVEAGKHLVPASQVFVDTDSQQYANHAREFGAVVPFLRPTALASDETTDFASIASFCRRYGFTQDVVIVHLRPTTPLRDPAVLKGAIRLFERERHHWSSMRSVHEMAESAYKSFEMSSDRQLKPFGDVATSMEQSNRPRQSFPTTFSANGYVDLFPVSNIEKLGSLHGEKVFGYVTPVAIEIDSAFELELARALAPSLQLV